jgi:DHA1 family tetracycline resistance protein-like MFS transporter
MGTLRAKRSTLFAIYFTFFVDSLCWAVVFPIFAPYFLDPENVLFSSAVSQETRTSILGLFLMSFSLGQFMGAPVLGEYGDKHGRRRALLLSVFFTLIGLGVSAWSMRENWLALLFFGRLVNGIFAGSNSICFSCIADVSEDEKAKVRNFGYLAMVGGIAFVFGAFSGGKLSDRELHPSFSADLPLWISAGFSFLNFLFVLFGFKETSIVHPQVKFHFFQAFRNIKLALREEKIKTVYGIYFLFLFAWTLLFQFVPVLAIDRFSFTNSDIGNLALLIGVCWAVGSGYLNKILVHYFKTSQILEFCLIGFTLLCTSIILPKESFGMMAILGSCVALGGIGWPVCTGMISGLASQKIQGKVLGLSQSVQSFAMAIAPAIGGFAFHVSLNFPFLLAAAASFAAGLAYYFTLKE